MRSLMLGWEFPPRRSGGLGTACEGIVQGLARVGAEVLFVVPSEDEAGVRVIARAPEGKRVAVLAVDANVPIPSPHPPRGLALDHAAASAVAEIVADSPQFQSIPDAPAWEERESTSGARHAHPRLAHADADDSLRMLRVASPLRPYQTCASYADLPVTANPGTDIYASGPSANTPAKDLFAEIERYAAEVAEITRHESFDVIHAHDWMTLPAALRAQEISGKPLVWHVHSCEYDRRPADPDGGICALEQLGFDIADRVITVSRFTAEKVARHYRVASDRIRVVHNAVNRAEYVPARRSARARPTVLFLGRLTAQKDPITFVRAARLVVDSNPSARFIVGGSGDLLPELVAEVERLGLVDQVHFTGFLSGKDVQRMYALADVYVMPSHSEPFGISALEAMCADVPVIISDRTGVAEVLPHALTFERGDAAALATHITALLEHPQLRQSLVEQGRRDVGALRWDVRARAILQIYGELVA